MRDEELIARLEALGVARDEVVERFARASGPGGQHVNKTSTAVTLACERLGITATCQDTRSQARNREIAWERLVEALENRKKQAAAERVARREKARRRNRRRPRALKERILESKRHRGRLKNLRSKPHDS